MKKLISMMLAVAMLLSMCVASAGGNSPEDQYTKAWQKAVDGKYAEAAALFSDLGDYEDSAALAYLLGVSAYAERMVAIGDAYVIAYRFHDQWGLINLQEQLLIPPTWDGISELSMHGLAYVTCNGYCGYINAKGESVIDCVWTNVSSFSGDLCTVQIGSGSAARYGLMNAQGVEVTPAMWREIGGSRGGYILAPVFMHGRIAVRNGDGYGLMDETGTVRGDVCWEEAPDLRNAFPMVKKNNRYGFINLDGVVVVPVTYRQAMDFSDGLAAVSSDGRLWGFVDPTGAVVVPQVYEQVQPYSGSVAHVKQPGMHWQIIDSTGQLVYFVTDQISADYDAAMALVAQEDYEGAAELLAGTIGYKDSYAQLLEARRLAPLKDAYNASVTYLVRGQYKEAIASLRQASGYKDADAKRATLEENVYQKGVSQMALEDYMGAASWFGIVPGYKDADAQAAACARLPSLKAAYDQAVAYLAEGKYKDAIASFGKASGYKDADDQKAAVQETVYQKGMSLMAAEDYAGAASWFGIVPGYKDAAAQVGECTRLKPLKAAYDQGVAYLAEGKYKEAIAAFSNATGYKDADNQKAAVQEIVYQKGVEALMAGDRQMAGEYLVMVMEYKDASELLAEAGIAGVRVRNIGSYGFVMNEDGFYESTNQSVPDSYAMCEVTFSTSTGVVYIDYINRGQARRDYGIVSQLDCTLIRSATADKQNVLLDLSGKNSPVVKSYPIYVPDDGEHTITIKYIKDGSGNQFEDSLQFRIRFD